MSKRIASLGLGGRGTSFADTFRQLGMYGSDVEFVGGYDVNPDNSRQWGRRFGIEIPMFDSPEKLLRETRPDAVIIASFDSAHLENFQAVASLDLPVMIEKPLEASLERARRLAELASNREAPVLMAHNMRFAPILQRARNLLLQGVIGRVNSFRFENNVHYGHCYFRNWMRQRKHVGDILLEKGAHDLDILHMLTGSRTRNVFALSRRFEFGGDRANDLHCRDCQDRTTCRDAIGNYLFEVEGTQVRQAQEDAVFDLCVYAKEIDVTDDNVCLLQLADGSHGTYVQTLYTPKAYKSRIYRLVGSLGIMEIDLDEYAGELRIYRRYGSKNDLTTETFDYHHRHHYNGDHYMVRHFYDMITGKSAPQCTVEDGLAAVEAATAAVRSSDAGISVQCGAISK